MSGEAAQTAARTGRSTAGLPIPLGRRLRPILLGVGGTAALESSPLDAPPPDLMVGVYAYDGTLLGYLVAQSLRGAGAWGGLTAHDLGLPGALALARRSAAALALLDLPQSAHHCLCLTHPDLDAAARARRESDFLDALQPLARLGLVRVVYREDAAGLQPALAHAAAAAGAAESVVAVLRGLGIDPERATLSVHEPSPPAAAAAAALERRGLQQLDAGGSALAADADVLLVGNPFWSVGPGEASAIRARVVLPIGAASVGADIEQRLHKRGIALLPDTLPIAGMMAALTLRARGAAEADALIGGLRILVARVDALLAEAAQVDEPLRTVARAASAGAR